MAGGGFQSFSDCVLTVFGLLSRCVREVFDPFVVVFGRAVGKKVFLTSRVWTVDDFWLISDCCRSFLGLVSSRVRVVSSPRNGPKLTSSRSKLAGFGIRQNAFSEHKIYVPKCAFYVRHIRRETAPS